jgi:hypothetical protein
LNQYPVQTAVRLEMDEGREQPANYLNSSISNL